MSEAWFRIAQVFFRKDRCGGTEAMYEPLKRCLDLDPCNANARELTASACALAMTVTSSPPRRSSARTIRLDPTNPTAPWHLGYMLEHYFGDFQGAAGAVRRRRVDSSSSCCGTRTDRTSSTARQWVHASSRSSCWTSSAVCYCTVFGTTAPQRMSRAS